MQSPKEVIMVRPAAFGYDPETAESNVFQNKPLNGDHDSFQEKAVKEFDNAVLELQSNGVRVTIFDEDDTDSVKKPDSIFPNNIIIHTTLYPMLSKSRRLEKRFDIVSYLKHNFQVIIK